MHTDRQRQPVPLCSVAAVPLKHHGLLATLVFDYWSHDESCVVQDVTL